MSTLYIYKNYIYLAAWLQLKEKIWIKKNKEKDELDVN